MLDVKEFNKLIEGKKLSGSGRNKWAGLKESLSSIVEVRPDEIHVTSTDSFKVYNVVNRLATGEAAKRQHALCVVVIGPNSDFGEAVHYSHRFAGPGRGFDAVAVASPRKGKWTIGVVIEEPPAPVTAKLADVFPSLESAAPLPPSFLVLTKGGSGVGSEDGRRYVVPRSVAWAKGIEAGGVLVCRRPVRGGKDDKGEIFGIGRIAKEGLVDDPKTKQREVEFDRFTFVTPPLPVAGLDGAPSFKGSKEIEKLDRSFTKSLIDRQGLLSIDQAPSISVVATHGLDGVDLGSFVANFSKYLDDRRLVFTESERLDLLACALSSQFVLIAGPSGSGKSTAARALAAYVSDRSSVIELPSGLSRQEEFLGYFSQFTNKYVSTPYFAQLRQLEENGGSPPCCIIEEVNLSPIEGYLMAAVHALSAVSAIVIDFPLQRQGKAVESTDGGPAVPEMLGVGPFPRFIGTVNVDPTAPAPAKKVTGRASVVLLEAPAVVEALRAVDSLGTAADSQYAGAGIGVVGDPAAPLELKRQRGEFPEVTGAVEEVMQLLSGILGQNVVTPRDATRACMYVAAYDLLATASGVEKSVALSTGAENALLHVVLPGLTGSLFDQALRKLHQSPDVDPNGLLWARLDRLVSAYSDGALGPPPDFWTALS